MPKFADTYTDEQRAAVVAEALASGNRKEAVRRAAAGKLAAGLEPFDISYTYVCELVAAEQLRRDPEGTAARGKSAAELADDILRRELRRLDASSRANRLNAGKVREMARALRELDAIARRAPTPPAQGNQGAGNSPDSEAPRSILERLAEQEAAARGPERPYVRGDRDASTEGSRRDAGAAAMVDRSEAKRAASAVRSRVENLRALAGDV